MTEKRFSIRSYDGINCHIFDRSIVIAEVDRRDINNLCNLLNELSDENKQLKQRVDVLDDQITAQGIVIDGYQNRNQNLFEHIKSLEKQCVLLHMSSMFSTVKSFNGDVSKRYKYSEKTDTIYDTANHYGQYDKILDKKEITMLLNEYETILKELEE